MRSRTFSRCSCARILFFACLVIAAAPAVASDVGFASDSGARIQVSPSTVVFSISGIQNSSDFSSGTLRLEVWAAATPPVPATVVGTVPGGYKLAQLTLGTLGAGQQFTNLKSPAIPLGTPPDGVWFYILFLTEFTGAGANDGFTVADWVIELSGVAIGAARPPPPMPTGLAVEYYNAAWGFYFVTAFPAEIEALDGGAFNGAWQRTGEGFKVWPQPSAGLAPMCRFFSDVFAPKSTHFYTDLAAECGALKASPAWTFEGIAFYVLAADGNGACPGGTAPLYRLYNNGMGGAPNHRYTTSVAVLQAMLAAGWSFEGDGRTKAFACVPA